jgi:hypothetical protein
MIVSGASAVGPHELMPSDFMFAAGVAAIGAGVINLLSSTLPPSTIG